MNMKLVKLLTLTLVGSILLSFAGMLPVYAQMEGDLTMVNPLSGDENFIFDTTMKSFGDTFIMEVWFEPNGSQNVFGWQLKIGYDTTLLDCVGDSLPTGHIFDGLGISHPPPVINEGTGEYFSLCSLISGYVTVSAPVVLVEITWEITASPSIVDPVLSCNFTFLSQGVTGGTYLLNDLGERLDLGYPGGYYEYSWLAPTEKPYLEVRDPVDGNSEIVGNSVGQILEIDIYIHNCSAAWEMISVSFELWYNTTLLSFVGTATNPEYDNGTFMESFVGPHEMGTFYIVVADFEGDEPIPPGAPIGENYFWAGVMKMPTINGTFEAPFPDGEGLLITLKVETLIQGLFPEIYTCALDLRNCHFYNRYGEELEKGTCQDGTYKMLPKVLGRSIDVFVCDYPEPFGGQGLMQPSDMFWPQKEVCLCANVTYNDWPEQGKDVAFQIIDPYGGTWAVLYGRTDEFGIARVCFRLPWPCDEFEYWFGEWTVVATVDIACEIKNDTLWFKYDHLVHITKVTLDKAEYAHCEYMEITVEFQSYAMQYYNVTITITALDETGVPFGYAYISTTIGGAVYCTYKVYEVGDSIHVVKWARAGTGTIIVGVLNDFPFNGGTAIGVAVEQPVTILAEWAI